MQSIVLTQLIGNLPKDISTHLNLLEGLYLYDNHFTGMCIRDLTSQNGESHVPGVPNYDVCSDMCVMLWMKYICIVMCL